MAKAKTRIKFGSRDKSTGDKSHLQTIEPGQDVPADIVGNQKDATDLAHAIDDEGEFEPAFDPDDPESYAGEEAAKHSKLMAPDNPNRPSSIEGEDSWKVTEGTAWGRGSASVIGSVEQKPNDPKAEARRENQRKAAGKGPIGGQASPATGAANANSPKGDAGDDKGGK